MSTRGGFVIEEVSISWMECDCGESDDECNWVTESRSSGPHFRGVRGVSGDLEGYPFLDLDEVDIRVKEVYEELKQENLFID